MLKIFILPLNFFKVRVLAPKFGVLAQNFAFFGLNVQTRKNFFYSPVFFGGKGRELISLPSLDSPLGHDAIVNEVLSTIRSSAYQLVDH